MVIGLSLLFGYWFVTAIWPIAGTQIAQLALGAITPPAGAEGVAWSSLIRDAAIGFAVGLVIGAIRYVLRIKNEVVEDIIDAMATPDVLSVSKATLGVLWVLWHGIAGAVAGFVLGWTGMIQLPQLNIGSAPVVLPTAGSAINLLVTNGLFGSGGTGPPPEGSHLLIALVIVIVVLLLVIVIGTVVVTATLAAFGKAFASGFVGGVSKHLGINVVLVLTRIWRRSIARWPNPKNLPPLDFGQEVERYIDQEQASGQVQRRLARIGEYFEWLQVQHLPITPTNILQRLPEYLAGLESSGQKPSRVLAAFQRYLQDVQQQSGQAFQSVNLDEVAFAFAQHRRRVLERFSNWLRSQGLPLESATADERYYEFARTLESSDEMVSRDFIARLREQRLQRRLFNVPQPIDGLPDQLFYKGWWVHSLGQALWIGCVTGFLSIGSSVINLLLIAARAPH